MTNDYLTANELSAYPFKDNESFKASNDYVLDFDVIADLIVIAKQKIQKAKLVTIGNSASTITLTLQGTFYTGDETLTVSVPYANIESHKLFTASNDFFYIKLVLGIGFSKLLNAPASSTFSIALVESSVIPPVPRVTSVTFNNTVEGLITQIAGDELTNMDLTLEEGTNIAFGLDNSKMTLSVEPGFGVGKYNPCDNDLVIKTINAIGPDRFQNFLLTTDDCYETEKGYDDDNVWINNYGITISNTCTPKCTAAQLSSFAHYLNRVRDGMDTIVTQASAVQQSISNAITAFNSDNTRTDPVITVAVSSFDNPYGSPYHSFVVSFFNKSEVPLEATVSVPGMSPISGTARWKQGKTTTPTGSLASQTTVACHAQARFEFILQFSGEVEINAECGDTNYSNTFLV